MLSPDAFLSDCRELGFSLFSGVPCSHLAPLIDAAEAHEGTQYIGATNEGDAAAIAAGAALSGRSSAVLLQNSGLGNAVSPLTSLHAIFKIPVLLLISWRGDPEGGPDEPQHSLMGRITPELLGLMDIPFERLPEFPDAAQASLLRARAAMADGRPFALLVGKGTFTNRERARVPDRKPLVSSVSRIEALEGPLVREEALIRIQAYCAARGAALIATTGHTGRTLYALGDEPNQFYLVGSMGCAASFGLGVALSKPSLPVVILDGDGAVLMRMGALATLGYERPNNLIHVLLDNEAHASTGGQATVSGSVDLAEIARACGYPEVIAASDARGLERALGALGSRCSFLHLKLGPQDSPTNLPRPKAAPRELALRFSGWLEGSSSSGRSP